MMNCTATADVKHFLLFLLLYHFCEIQCRMLHDGTDPEHVCVSRGRVEVFCCEFKWMFFYPKCKSCFVSLWYFVVTRWIWNAKLNLPFQSTHTLDRWSVPGTLLIPLCVCKCLKSVSLTVTWHTFTPGRVSFIIQCRFTLISTEEPLFR